MSDNEKIVQIGDKKSKKAQNKKDTPQAELIYCSFCGRPNNVVPKMIQGPGVNICSECVMIAVQYLILNDRIPSEEAQKILDLFWSKA